MAACFNIDNFNAATNRVSLPAVFAFCKESSHAHASRDTKTFLEEKGWAVVKEAFKRNRFCVIVGTAKDGLMMARELSASTEKQQSLSSCFGDLGEKNESLLLTGSLQGDQIMCEQPLQGETLVAPMEGFTIEEIPKDQTTDEQAPSVALALPSHDQVKAFMVHPDKFCIKFDKVVSEWLEYRFNNGERFVRSVLEKPGNEFDEHHVLRDGYHCFTVEGFKRLCLQCPKPRGQEVRTYFIECELELARASQGAAKAVAIESSLEIEQQRTEQARLGLETELCKTQGVCKQEETKLKEQDLKRFEIEQMVACKRMESDTALKIEAERTRQAELNVRSIELQLLLKRSRGAAGGSANASRTRPRTAEDEEARARLLREEEERRQREEDERAERARQREIREEEEAAARRQAREDKKQARQDAVEAKKKERVDGLRSALEEFFLAACTLEPEGRTSTAAFKDRFSEFVQRGDSETRPRASKKDLVGFMRAKGVTKKTARINKKAVQAYVGISLKA